MVDPFSSFSGQKSLFRGPLALSKDTCRFQLPMDVRDLENMSVLTYLSRHCAVSSRRNNLFKHFFNKFDRDRDGLISPSELCDALHELYVTAEAKDCGKDLIELLKTDESYESERSKEDHRKQVENDATDEESDVAKYDENGIPYMNFTAFKGSAAVVERMMYARKYGKSNNDNKLQRPNHRLPLEQTDFSALSWKLQGININPYISVIFSYL